MWQEERVHERSTDSYVGDVDARLGLDLVGELAAADDLRRDGCACAIGTGDRAGCDGGWNREGDQARDSDCGRGTAEGDADHRQLTRPDKGHFAEDPGDD